MDQYVSFFKALSDETRLKLVVLLSEAEFCVCQLEKALTLTQTKVSRHLSVLKNAGIVTRRRDGVWIYYSLNRPKNILAQSVFSAIKKELLKNKDVKGALSSAKKCKCQGEE